MKKKLTLDKLKVESFTTKLDGKKQMTAQGGAQDPTLGGGSECPTVITYGYWTYCCDTYTES